MKVRSELECGGAEREEQREGQVKVGVKDIGGVGIELSKKDRRQFGKEFQEEN